MGSKGDLHYIEQALIEIRTALHYTEGMDYAAFMSDPKTMDAVMFRLIQLGENIKNLSQDYRASHSEIPWGKIIGFRNGIVHAYGNTDYTTVYEVIRDDLPQLQNLFEESKTRI